MIIPTEIVEKIKLRNQLDDEIERWCDENIDIEGMDTKYADITCKTTGQPNRDGEWCEQHHYIEDSYYGHYYYPTETDGEYVHMEFEM